MDKEERAGYKEIIWNAHNLSGGIYILRMTAEAEEGGNKFNSIKKLLLLK